MKKGKEVQQKSAQQKFVVVTRSKEEGRQGSSGQGSDRWLNVLRECGFNPYHFPTIEVVQMNFSPEQKAELLEILEHISQFDWIVFTSANGVRFFTEFLEKCSEKEAKKDHSAISPKIMPNIFPKIAAIGEWTANAVRDAGYQVAFEPSKAEAKTLAEELPLEQVTGQTGARKQSVLLLRTVIASQEPVALLEKRGANITDFPIYQTRPITQPEQPDSEFSRMLADDRISCVMFASRSSVEGFCARVPAELLDKVRLLLAVAISQNVQAFLEKFGFKNVRTASAPSIEGIVTVLRAQSTDGL